jgi:hypothetical protein
MRHFRLAIGLLALEGRSLSSTADAGPPRPTHEQALARVGKMHDAISELMAIVRRARGRNAAVGSELVPLDATTSPGTYACATSGTVEVTETYAGGGGTGTVTVAATTCTTSSKDTLNGSVSFTYTTSGGGSTTRPTVTTAAYSGGVLKVAGPNAGTYAPAGLVVTTTSTSSGGTTTTTSTVDGTATIDGNPAVFKQEPLKK